MSDLILRERIIKIKKELLMNYNTIGVYCGYDKYTANYIISKYVLKGTSLNEGDKIKIDEFLKKFNY